MGVTLTVRRAAAPHSTTSRHGKLSLRRSYARPGVSKLTWLVLGGDPAARSHRVEQFTACWGLERRRSLRRSRPQQYFPRGGQLPSHRPRWMSTAGVAVSVRQHDSANRVAGGCRCPLQLVLAWQWRCTHVCRTDRAPGVCATQHNQQAWQAKHAQVLGVSGCTELSWRVMG